MKSFKQYIAEHIEKRGKKWVVTDSKRKRVLGTHRTRRAAERQLMAIEISKHQNQKEEE